MTEGCELYLKEISSSTAGKGLPPLHLRDGIDTLIRQHVCVLNIYAFLRVEKKVRNSPQTRVISSCSRLSIGRRELPRAPGPTEIAEVGESLRRGTQTG